MSRQYDEYIEGKFELDGEYHGLVEPSTPEQLGDAYRIRDLIQEGIDRHMPDDAEGYQQFMDEQDSYIREYVDGLGDFDNTLLIKNIGVLLRKNGLRLGDLENALGISTGYISRTSKPGSGKKMSIDIVWKIARLFGVSVQDLIESDLSAPTTNTNLVVRFLTKLLKQTSEDEIEWEEGGDALCAFENYLYDSGILSHQEKHRSRYRPTDHLNPNAIFILEDMIYACKGVRPGWYLAIIPYSSVEHGGKNIDCIFFRPVGEIKGGKADSCEWERGFYSSDDPCRDVSSAGINLYKMITAKAIDTRLTKDVKSWMTDYLS